MSLYIPKQTRSHQLYLVIVFTENSLPKYQTVNHDRLHDCAGFQNYMYHLSSGPLQGLSFSYSIGKIIALCHSFSGNSKSRTCSS